MLTDTALRHLKPKSKIYKAFDRDGMYVTVSPSGTVTFRYDYRFNGRRETLTIGRYGPDGISLAMARELLLDARKSILKGISPALEKQREKRRVHAIKTFGTAMEAWLANAKLADSTRAMRKHIIDRDILPVFRNRLLTEIEPEDLRALCNKVKERGAPATAVQIRDIVKQVYVYAIAHGEKVDNPANSVGAASIATFVPKDRALSPLEIRLFVQQMESVATYPTIKLALRLILLTLVRKSDHKRSGGPSLKDKSGKDRTLVDVLRDVVNHLTSNKTDKEAVKALHGAITELAKPDGILSVTSMNQLVHNKKFSVQAGDIAGLFGNVFPLLEAMNS